jgi:hypothetical protein
MAGGKYALGTTVEPDKSQAEISHLLRRYGADGFAYGWEQHRAVIQFKAHGRQVRFILNLPTDPKQFAKSEAGRWRDAKQMEAALQAEVRRLWRCLVLAIKSKLEVVESGIASFEEEFLANIMLPSGNTVGDEIQPAIEQAYTTGQVRPLLQIEG